MPFTKLTRLALDGITTFSFVPLQAATFLGFATAGIGLMLTLALVYLRLFTNTPIIGWTSTMVAILTLSGVQLVTIGIVGGYIGRIFEEVKRRPLYLVDEAGGFGIHMHKPRGLEMAEYKHPPLP